MSRDCARCDKSRYEVAVRGEWVQARLCPACFKVCPRCNNERFTPRTNAQGYEFLSPCSCQGILNRVNRFSAARIPGRYAQCSLLSYEDLGGNQRKVHQRVFTHVQGFQPGGPGLVLAGKVGTGKTHLLVGILRDLALEAGQQVRFIEFTHLLADIKEGFSRRQTEAEVLAPLARIPVLGIDELGKGLSTAWQLSMLDELISRRYNQRLTTYFTTNLPLSVSAPELGRVGPDTANLRRALETISLRDRIGDRIFSRLHQMCEVIEVLGPDARMRGPTG